MICLVLWSSSSTRIWYVLSFDQAHHSKHQKYPVSRTGLSVQNLFLYIIKLTLFISVSSFVVILYCRPDNFRWLVSTGRQNTVRRGRWDDPTTTGWYTFRRAAYPWWWGSGGWRQPHDLIWSVETGWRLTSMRRTVTTSFCSSRGIITMTWLSPFSIMWSRPTFWTSMVTRGRSSLFSRRGLVSFFVSNNMAASWSRTIAMFFRLFTVFTRFSSIFAIFRRCGSTSLTTRSHFSKTPRLKNDEMCWDTPKHVVSSTHNKT